VSLFSLLSFSQETGGSLAHKFAGEGWNKDIDRALIQGNLALPGGKQQRGDLAGGKQTTKKLSCQSLSNQILLILRLFSLNNSKLCMENLCAMEPSRSWLRPYFVSSPLNNLSGCTGRGKVSCR
jgi:hypothetical protein